MHEENKIFAVGGGCKVNVVLIRCVVMLVGGDVLAHKSWLVDRKGVYQPRLDLRRCMSNSLSRR